MGFNMRNTFRMRRAARRKNKKKTIKPTDDIPRIPTKNDSQADVNNTVTKKSSIQPDSSMMTPDMLEVLGLTELHKSYAFKAEKPKDAVSEKPKKDAAANVSLQIRKHAAKKPKKKDASTNPTAKKAEVLAGRRNSTMESASSAKQASKAEQTTRENEKTERKMKPPRAVKSSKKQPSKKKKSAAYNEPPSCLYFADNDDNKSTCTSSTCSSDFSDFEPTAQDPCDSYDFLYDWTFSGVENNSERGNRKTSKTDSEDSAISTSGFEPLTLVGMVLTMPIACGLLLVDNVLDTNYFETASKNLKRATSDAPSDAPSADKPKFLVIQEKKRRPKTRRASPIIIAC